MQPQWSFENAWQQFCLPFADLIYKAQTIHRENFQANTVQISTLLSIKTGKCPEDCAYCPQSGHYNTKIKREPLMQLEDVVQAAKAAKACGATRFCMGAAWRGPTARDLDAVNEMVRAVKDLGLETCVTLGLIDNEQATKLKDSGLDYYNHNIDTSEEYYEKIISTRTFKQRIETLECVRQAGIKVCCGGILGMGETNQDRVLMLMELSKLSAPPESIPINKLIKIPGTPLSNALEVDPLDFVRTIALARIMFPKAYIRLSAGREDMSEELQTMCFLAGINSIFYGEKLLTASNPEPSTDNTLLAKLGMEQLS